MADSFLCSIGWHKWIFAKRYAIKEKVWYPVRRCTRCWLMQEKVNGKWVEKS